MGLLKHMPYELGMLLEVTFFNVFERLALRLDIHDDPVGSVVS